MKLKGKPYFSKDNAHRFLLKSNNSCLLYHIDHIEKYNTYVFLIPKNDIKKYTESDFIKSDNGPVIKECFILNSYTGEESIISYIRDKKIKEILE